MIGIQFDTQALQAKLNEFAGKLSPQQMGRSIALGINKTLKQARTQTDRDIRKVFNLRQAFVLKYIKLKNARNTNLVGDVIFPTTPVPMGEFMGTKGGKAGRGGGRATQITVEIIKGQAKILNGAFFMQSIYSPSNSRLSIMHRSYVSGSSSYAGQFQFRHKRINSTGSDLTIGAMFAPSPFSTLFNQGVKKEVIKHTEEKLQINIFETLDKMAAGVIRDSNNKGRY